MRAGEYWCLSLSLLEISFELSASASNTFCINEPCRDTVICNHAAIPNANVINVSYLFAIRISYVNHQCSSSMADTDEMQDGGIGDLINDLFVIWIPDRQ